MYKNILISTDGSENSEKAAKQAIALAKSLGAKLTGVFVGQTYPTAAKIATPWFDVMSPEQFTKLQKQHAEGYLNVIKKQADKSKVAFEPFFTISASPYEGILETAKNQGCDLIVMASHGRKGIDSVLLGSEATKVLTHSKIPVLIFR